MAIIIAGMDNTKTPMTNAALAARDLKHVWHPCTQMHDHETMPMVPAVRGEGAWLFHADGNPRVALREIQAVRLRPSYL